MIYRPGHGRTRSAGKERGQEISCFYTLNKNRGNREERERERNGVQSLPCESWTPATMSFDRRGAVGHRRMERVAAR